MKLLFPYAVFSALLLLYHCAFHILYLNTAASATAWLVALRYTSATVAAAFFFPGLLWLVTGKIVFLRKIALWFTGILIYLCALILVGDLVYYRQAGKHSTIELLLFLQNFSDVGRMVFRDYLYALLAGCVSGILFFWFWAKQIRLMVPQQFAGTIKARSISVRLLRQTLVVVLFVLAHVIVFRGGLQERPVRPADAYQYLSQREADFALNGLYTSFYSVYHGNDFPARGGAESIQRVQSLMRAEGEKFPSPELPFYRTVNPRKAAIKKNVIFIILESWSARRVGVFGDKTGATPFFDSLSKKGWLLTNAFATGRRSIASLPSAISSIPSLYGSLYITSPHEQNFQRGMGSLFRAQGYATHFTYAAKAGSMGFNAFARLAGFDHITTRDSFPRDTPNDGVWGVYDHIMFAHSLAEFDAAPKPALSAIYTLHPHSPFTLPPGNNFYADDQPRARYYNALRYSDNTLREFFTAAEKKTWFKDTVFVLIADHAFEDVQGFDAFHVPLLFYSPGFIPPKQDATVASELDVLPTLIDLLHFETAHASMGRSLLAPAPHFAFIDAEHSAGIIRERQGELVALFFGTEQYSGHFNMTHDRE